MLYTLVMEENLNKKYTAFLPSSGMTKVDNYSYWGNKKVASLKYRKYGCCCCKMHSNWHYTQFQ